MAENLEKSDKLTEINTTLTETENNYYSDIYNPGEIKEQLVIGGEVASEKSVSGTIDTSGSFDTTNNIYTLSVPNPDNEMISLTVDGLDYIFNVPNYGSSALAYAELEGQLKTKLGENYVVDYVSGTNFSLSRLDKTELSVSRPSLIKKLEISGWSNLAVIDITIDGVTYTFDGVTYPSISDILTYLYNTLSTATYYLKNKTTYLLIGRTDLAIPVITTASYPKYTYLLSYLRTDTPSAGQFLDYLTTTIDSTTWINSRPFLAGRAYRGDVYASNLAGIEMTTTPTFTNDPLNLGGSSYVGTTFKVKSNTKLTTVTRITGCTATKARLSFGGTTLEEVSFSGDAATFSTELTAGNTYTIALGSDGSAYTGKYRQLDSAGSGFPTTYNNYVEIYHNPTYNNGSLRYIPNIASIGTTMNIEDYGYEIYNVSIDSTYGNSSTFNLRKTDLSRITTLTNINTYTDTFSFPNDSFGTSETEYENTATITVSTYTEITITNTLASNNYFIPVRIKINKITMKAVSSAGSSEGVYELRTQSCTTKYSTTTAFIDDFIFKTDANNYGKITEIKRGGFIINWVTDKSNKLDYICT